MEFPDLGKHCNQSECNQTDFLPLQCDCGYIFCKDHFQEHCLCGECELSPKPKDIRLITDDVFFKCSNKKCKVSTLHVILCPKCNKHFCIAHRFHPECPEVDPALVELERKRKEEQKEYIITTDVNLQAKITEKIRQALQTPKARTAMKIHLMRVKQKAKGSKAIPTTDRVYFSINKPFNGQTKHIENINNLQSLQSMPSVNFDVDLKDSIPVFICKTWTMGRNLDSICETCDIVNENNKQNDRKVRLFRFMDGYCIRKLDATLNELLNEQILVEGDRLLVEYVDANDLANIGNSEMLLKLPVESKN